MKIITCDSPYCENDAICAFSNKRKGARRYFCENCGDAYEMGIEATRARNQFTLTVRYELDMEGELCQSW